MPRYDDESRAGSGFLYAFGGTFGVIAALAFVFCFLPMGFMIVMFVGCVGAVDRGSRDRIESRTDDLRKSNDIKEKQLADAERKRIDDAAMGLLAPKIAPASIVHPGQESQPPNGSNHLAARQATQAREYAKIYREKSLMAGLPAGHAAQYAEASAKWKAREKERTEFVASEKAREEMAAREKLKQDVEKVFPSDPTLTRDGQLRIEIKQDAWIAERIRPELDRIEKEYRIN